MQNFERDFPNALESHANHSKEKTYIKNSHERITIKWKHTMQSTLLKITLLTTAIQLKRSIWDFGNTCDLSYFNRSRKPSTLPLLGFGKATRKLRRAQNGFVTKVTRPTTQDSHFRKRPILLFQNFYSFRSRNHCPFYFQGLELGVSKPSSPSFYRIPAWSNKRFHHNHIPRRRHWPLTILNQ